MSNILLLNCQQKITTEENLVMQSSSSVIGKFESDEYARSKFNAGYSHSFTKQCIGRFYQDTSIDGATAMKERHEKAMEKRNNEIEAQREKLEVEIAKVEMMKKHVLRKQQREAKRIISHRNAAATLIQSVWKAHGQRKQYLRLLAYNCLAGRWKVYQDRSAYIRKRDAHRQEVRENNASVILSRAFKMNRTNRRNERLQIERTNAAVRLQCTARSFIAKSKARYLRNEADMQRKKYEAAIVIQKNYRCYLVREIYLEILFLIMKAQSVVRGYLVRKRKLTETSQDDAGREEEANVETIVEAPGEQDEQIEDSKPSRVREKLMQAVEQSNPSTPKRRHSLKERTPHSPRISSQTEMHGPHSRCSRCTHKGQHTHDSPGEKSAQKVVGRRRNSLPSNVHGTPSASTTSTHVYSAEEVLSNLRAWNRKKDLLQKQEALKAQHKKEAKREAIERGEMGREDRAMRVLRKLSQQRQRKMKAKKEKKAPDTPRVQEEVVVPESFTPRSSVFEGSIAPSECEDYSAKSRAYLKAKEEKKQDELRRAHEVKMMEREDRAVRILIKMENRLVRERRLQKQQQLLREKKRLQQLELQKQMDLDRKPEIPKQKTRKRLPKKRQKYHPRQPYNGRLEPLVDFGDREEQEDEYRNNEDEEDEYLYADEFDELVDEEALGLMCSDAMNVPLNLMHC